MHTIAICQVWETLCVMGKYEEETKSFGCLLVASLVAQETKKPGTSEWSGLILVASLKPTGNQKLPVSVFQLVNVFGNNLVSLLC